MITSEMIKKDYNLLGLLEESKREPYFDIIFKHPEALKYFSKEKQTRKILNQIPFHKHRDIFNYLDHSLLSTEEIFWFLEDNISNYEYLSVYKRKDIKFIKKVLDSSPDGLSVIDTKHQSEEVVRYAISKNLSNVNHVRRYEFLTVEDVVNYLKVDSSYFWQVMCVKDIPDDFRKNNLIIETALKADGDNLRLLDNPTLEQCLIAVEKPLGIAYTHIPMIQAKSNSEAKKMLLEKQKILSLINSFEAVSE